MAAGVVRACGCGKRRSPAVASALALVLLCAGAALAEVSARAHLDRSQVQVGSAANLSIEVAGAQNAPAPALSAPDGLSLRYLGPATQVSIVNGQMSASVTHRYAVTALKAGTYTLGPIIVDLGGQQLDAGSVTLQAVAGAPPRAGGSGAAAPAEVLRLVLSTPKAELYLHERVPLTLKLYIGNVRVADVQYPTLPGEGLAVDKFPEPTQRQEQTAEGVFQVVDFQTMLTPLRSGPLPLGPAKMSLNVLSRRRGGGDPFFERFFGDDPFSTQRRPVELQSEPLTLTVLPLPEAGKPADFSGAVGAFEFEAKAAPLELAVGDPVTVTVTISGAGNLDNVTAPAITGSDTLRAYPVQAQPSDQPQEKVFEQVVMPQQPGAMTLPALRFSYFDPAARAYRTISPPPIALAVRPSAQAQAAPQIVGAAPPAWPRVQEPLGRDIVFIKDAPGEFTPIGARRYHGALFWLYQPIPLLAWIAVVLYDRRRLRLSGDERYARFTRAGRAARQAIAGARAALQAGDQAGFYNAVARAVSDYLSAKLDLPPGSVTADSASARLQARGLPGALAIELEEFFATCERVRFSPGAAGADGMERTLERADAIVRALERERRLARSAAALLMLLALAGLAVAATPAAEAPNTIFFHANALYSEERYGEAAAEYERVLTSGWASASLYFNLGNAYFKAGDAGRAALNYQRAHRLRPRDPDVRANLGYAQELSGDTEALPMWARLLFPLAERMTGDELLLAATAVYTALVLVLICGRLLPTTRRLVARLALAAGLVLALVLSSGVYRLAAMELPPYAVVVAAAEATVRFEPSASGTAHYAVKPGSVVRIITEREGWAQVARRDGQRGWLERAALAAL
ncbi:MAG: BatD family protein [Deltaproteobacteria bacterium]|nr:BatD family protein [Deltaproteobacteria bacterium]